MSQSDGKVKIDVELNANDAIAGLKQLKGALSDLGNATGILSGAGGQINGFIGIFEKLRTVIGTKAAAIVTSIAAIGTAFKKLYDASKQNFAENIEKYAQVFKQIGTVIMGVASNIKNAFTEVTGFNFDFGSIIAGAVEFESTMARVSAIMNVTGGDMDKLTAKTRDIAASSRYTAKEVGDAFSYMGMAGFSLNESLASINDVLHLCTISGGDLAQTSDIVTDNLTAMQMSAGQAGDMVDMMAATITKSNTNVEMMGESMKYAGSVAGGLGVSFKDASVAIGLMAGSGVKASRAGTSLRTILSNLSAPTKAAAAAMDQYGIKTVYAEDGSMDLDKTLRNLRTSLKNVPLKEQAAACKALAGRTGMTGLMAIVNATDEAYDDLYNSVENSTRAVSYWNENLMDSGVKGEECAKRISTLNQVLDDTEYIGAAFNTTTQDMALALQVLSSDAKITSKDVEDLFNVFSVMRDPTKEQSKTLNELGLKYREVDDTAFDYSKTCEAIDNSVGKLTESQKANVKEQLNANMSMKEANQILKEYGIQAQSKSTGQIDMIANLKEIRKAFGGMSEGAREAALKQLGLADSIDEVNEICSLSDAEFKKYCENLSLVTGLSEKMANAMDQTTKNSLLILASAMTDVGLEAFEKLKGGIQGVCNSLTNFFNIWRSGNKKGSIVDNSALYSLENFKKAMDNLLQDIKKADIAGAIGQAINGAVTFLKSGGLSSILNVGGEIIHQICQGIIQNKDGLETAISTAIGNICDFVTQHAGEIGQAGVTILEALKQGIEENTDKIGDAVDSIVSVMCQWNDETGELSALGGKFAGSIIKGFVTDKENHIKNGAKEFVNALGSAILGAKFPDMSKGLSGLLNAMFGDSTPDMKKGGTGLIKKISDWFSGESYGAEKEGSGKSKGKSGSKNKATSNLSDKLTSMDTKEIESFKKSLQSLEKIASTVSKSLNSSFSTMQNSIRTSLVGVANIVRNQMLSVTNVIRNQALNCSNIFRNQFVNMANIVRNQFVNVANIVRNQMLSVTNVIRNQALNARNAFTQQFMSMKNVASAQMTGVRTAIVSKMMSITSVVRTQARNARNAFTQQMISMKSVARTQAQGARNAVTSAMISMKNVITTQARQARNNFTQQMISMKNVARTQSAEAGRAVASGFASGIRAGTASAVSAARSMVDQVNAIVKSAAKIASPSKITTEFGEFYAQGFGGGIKKAMPSVVKNALSAIEGLNDKFRRVVNDEIRKVNVNAQVANSNKFITHNNASINESDMQKLVNAINKKQTVVEIGLDKKKVATVLAEPVKTVTSKIENRKKRLEG